MVVRAQMAKWGNSLAVRIPKNAADEAEFKEGDNVLIEVKGQGSLAVVAVKKPPTLEELVARITPENRHNEVDWGSPVGKEAW